MSPFLSGTPAPERERAVGDDSRLANVEWTEERERRLLAEIDSRRRDRGASQAEAAGGSTTATATATTTQQESVEGGK